MEKESAETPKRTWTSFSFLNRIGGVILAPDDTFPDVITERVGLWEPLLLLILLFAIQSAVQASFAYRVFSAFAGALSPLTGGFAAGGWFSIAVLGMVVATIIGVLIFWVVIAGIAHLCAKYVFRGNGSFVGLLRLYGYSFLPYGLVILSTVLFGISWTLWPISAFLSIVAIFWIVVLMAVAVKHNYRIDAGKAFISSFVGPMTLWLIVMGIFWVWILLMIRSLTGGLV
jgi:hypothetical protein